jgi:hypothetical protein
MEESMSDDANLDAKRLAELGKELPAIDVDSTSAQRIAHRARQSIGRGPSPVRLVEPLLVTLFAVSILVWAALKLYEVWR